MKKIYVLFVLFCCFGYYNSQAQNIKTIAAYDSESSYTSGLFCISDTSVYRYSWYYQEWFPLSTDGLTRVNDTVKVSVLAVYNNKINNSSGLFVFSDSAVFNYNWIVAQWYPLSNTGLPLVFGKPDVRELAVYGDSGSSSNSTLFALTSSGVYRYSWWYQEWAPIPNLGLNTKALDYPVSSKVDAFIFPNPVADKTGLKIDLHENIKGEITCVFYSMNGTVVHVEKFISGGNSQIVRQISLPDLPAGEYFCEIKASDQFKCIKFVKL